MPSADTFMSIDSLIDIAKEHRIDAIHPGYGFLSENADFARRLWEDARVVVVGPGWEILDATGDKLQARKVAARCMSLYRHNEVLVLTEL